MIIDTKAYTRDEWKAHIEGMEWISFSARTKKPLGVTLHNTWNPTLAYWVETDPQRLNSLNGLKHYYEGMGWHGGPHAFISRQFINGFTPLTEWGIHSTCFNQTHLGFEMIGNYAQGSESFDSGDGALVRDNAAFAIAVVMAKLGLSPNRDLVFHRDCSADHHDCPGSGVSKLDMVYRIKEEMQKIATPKQGYSVEQGDTLTKIALKFGTTWKALAAANGLEAPYEIAVGQLLKIV